MQIRPSWLHIGYIFPKVVHFSRISVLFLYVFVMDQPHQSMRFFFRSAALIYIMFISLVLTAFAQDSRSYENLVITGVDLYSKGEYQAAKAVLKNVADNDPSNDNLKLDLRDATFEEILNAWSDQKTAYGDQEGVYTFIDNVDENGNEKYATTYRALKEYFEQFEK